MVVPILLNFVPLDGNVPAALLDETVDHTETQPSAFAFLFGGKKRARSARSTTSCGIPRPSVDHFKRHIIADRRLKR